MSRAALPAWWEGLDPVVVDLAVDGATHRIRWHRGELVLDDHGDAESELALAALGGGRCACLDILDAWNAQRADPEILTVGRRHLAEDVHADRTALSRLEREAARWRTQWKAATEDLRVAGDTAGTARLQAIAERAERRLRVRLGFVRVLSLDIALQDRLQLTVLAAAESRWVDDGAFRSQHRARLHAALIARAAPALEAAGLLAVPPDAVELLQPGAEAVVNAGHVALPLSWLTNVWGRGVALDQGRFVTRVNAIEDGGKVLAVSGVDRPDWRISRA